jgi:acetyl esterase/lipase
VPVRVASSSEIVAATPGPQVIRLWPGKAPGSEKWTQQETQSNLLGETIVRNVVDPTLTAYFPPLGKANGTSIIICPGGGFHMLSVNSEGSDAARYLNSLGVTAFVLKYRLTRTGTAFFLDEARHFSSPESLRQLLDELTPLVVADGQQAVRIVRSHAAQWGLAPERIGMLGFSAGGYVALSLSLQHEPDTSLNFVAALYTLAPITLTQQPSRIPLFLLCAGDDPRIPPVENTLKVYTIWRTAGIPAELHIFAKGGHGFGMTRQNLPIDAWPDTLSQWLQTEGFLGPSIKP